MIGLRSDADQAHYRHLSHLRVLVADGLGLVPLGDDKFGAHEFGCPCPFHLGQTDHIAMVKVEGEAANFSVLNCYPYETQALVVWNEDDIAFWKAHFKWTDREGEIPSSLTGPEAYKLRNSKGVPVELLESRIASVAERTSFRSLLKRHRREGKRTSDRVAGAPYQC